MFMFTLYTNSPVLCTLDLMQVFSVKMSCFIALLKLIKLDVTLMLRYNVFCQTIMHVHLSHAVTREK